METMKEYDDIMSWIDSQLKKIAQKDPVEIDEYVEEWDKYIPGLRDLELDEKGNLVSFTAESRAKEFHNH